MNDNIDRSIPFSDQPRRYITCPACGLVYYPPVKINVDSIDCSCPYCGGKK